MIQRAIAKHRDCASCNNVSHAKANLVALNKNMLLGNASFLTAKLIRQVHTNMLGLCSHFKSSMASYSEENQAHRVVGFWALDNTT